MSFNTNDHLNWAHPLVRDWFLTKFGSPTEPQIQGWPPILKNKTTLISAPTGSGKTLAAFLACIDRLVRLALEGTLSNQTEVLYISPLKALSNDIQKNLMGPLNEITELAKERNLVMQEIKVSVRTGDTLNRERQAMLKKPPHILVTTPESLYILITAEKSRKMLAGIKTIIVDEIHALANDKRGTHLTLSLERLQAINSTSPVRIGLSATQKPLERAAEFLGGSTSIKPHIINIGHARQLEISIEVPKRELGPVASNEMWDEIYDRLAELATENRSTLVFVNTRRLAERVAHHLTERIGEDLVAAHHGSLSRKLRLAAETKLKTGQLKVLVATASLELGIDIGTVDLVCQIGSPRAIAVALQRIGRAGHWHGAISKGRIFATTRDELIECAALVYAIGIGDLDKLIIPEEPIDILAQQIIATCATGDWKEDDLFKLCTNAFSYKDLSRETFNSVIEMLADGIAASRGRYSAYLFRDRINGVVKARRGSRLTAITSGGAIPDNGLFTVIAEPQEIVVGTLDEDFAVESNRGDIILLGTTSWQVKRVESNSGRFYVEDAHGAPPSVPFWRGEAPARTDELSYYVSWLRQTVNEMLAIKETCLNELSCESQKQINSVKKWLEENCKLNTLGSSQLINYILQGRAVLGTVPTQTTIIAERFFDEAGGMQLVIHAPFGARINKAWGLALRKRFCRSFNFELQASATDDGLTIALSEQHSFPLADVFHFLNSNTIKEVLIQAALQSPLFATRWRWVACRALALVRFRNGKKVPPNIMRMLSDDLLAAVFPDAAACQDNLGGKDIELPNHPLINETIKDVLTEALDIEGLKTVLHNIETGSLTCLAVDTPVPSVFSHQILNANPYAYLDDAPLEERRARAVEMRRTLPPGLKEIGRLDADIILEVQQQAWPDIRNCDELHDVLQTLIAIPKNINHSLNRPTSTDWAPFFDELAVAGRAGLAEKEGSQYWVSVEKTNAFSSLYGEVSYTQKLIEIEQPELNPEEALVNMIRGWMFILGPTTNLELRTVLQLTPSEIEQALLKLESTGLILRGNFRNRGEEIEWCERRLLAKIHRLTLSKLRKEIEPVSPMLFMQWLLKWQHLISGTQLQGQEGLLEVIRQLQGFEIPAKVWEQQIFAKRVKHYKSEMLDYLCLSGQVGWGRFSLHPTFLLEAKKNEDSLTVRKRIIPTSIAPITFFIREESNWILGNNELNIETYQTGLSSSAKEIFQFLKQNGASFFSDIASNVNKLKSEMELGLWELVAAGLITADGFDNLRALIDVRRRLGKSGRRNRPRFSMGRWSILRSEKMVDRNEQLEAICWMLLKRYGVVFRDLLVRERNIPRWRDLLAVFRRLEDRGEIRGGRFVNDFLGEQFALPYAIDSLRAMRQSSSKEESITISALDPLNLAGIILPGARISGVSRKKVIINLDQQSIVEMLEKPTSTRLSESMPLLQIS